MITIIPIYWMIVVSTRSPVELFGKPDFSPTFFEKIYFCAFLGLKNGFLGSLKVWFGM